MSNLFYMLNRFKFFLRGIFHVLFLILSLLWIIFGEKFVEGVSDRSNVLLVCITAYYAYLTKLTLMETQKSRHLHARPIIVPKSLKFNGDRDEGDYACTTLKMENIGYGPAFSIKIRLIDSTDGKVVSDSMHYIDYLTRDSETDSEHIHISNQRLNALNFAKHGNELHASIILEITYMDAFKNSYVSRRAFSLKSRSRLFSPIFGSFHAID